MNPYSVEEIFNYFVGVRPPEISLLELAQRSGDYSLDRQIRSNFNRELAGLSITNPFQYDSRVRASTSDNYVSINPSVKYINEQYSLTSNQISLEELLYLETFYRVANGIGCQITGDFPVLDPIESNFYRFDSDLEFTFNSWDQESLALAPVAFPLAVGGQCTLLYNVVYSVERLVSRTPSITTETIINTVAAWGSIQGVATSTQVPGTNNTDLYPGFDTQVFIICNGVPSIIPGNPTGLRWYGVLGSNSYQYVSGSAKILSISTYYPTDQDRCGNSGSTLPSNPPSMFDLEDQSNANVRIFAYGAAYATNLKINSITTSFTLVGFQLVTTTAHTTGMHIEVTFVINSLTFTSEITT